MISIRCASCGKVQNVPDAVAGRTTPCSLCGKILAVPHKREGDLSVMPRITSIKIERDKPSLSRFAPQILLSVLVLALVIVGYIIYGQITRDRWEERNAAHVRDLIGAVTGYAAEGQLTDAAATAGDLMQLVGTHHIQDAQLASAVSRSVRLGADVSAKLQEIHTKLDPLAATARTGIPAKKYHAALVASSTFLELWPTFAIKDKHLLPLLPEMQKLHDEAAKEWEPVWAELVKMRDAARAAATATAQLPQAREQYVALGEAVKHCGIVDTDLDELAKEADAAIKDLDTRIALANAASQTVAMPLAAPVMKPQVDDLNGVDLQAWKLYVPKIGRFYVELDNRLYCFVNAGRGLRSSHGLVSDKVEGRRTVTVNLGSKTLVSQRKVAVISGPNTPQQTQSSLTVPVTDVLGFELPRDEIIVRTDYMRALAPDEFGLIHSAMIVDITGPQEMVVNDLWIVDKAKVQADLATAEAGTEAAGRAAHNRLMSSATSRGVTAPSVPGASELAQTYRDMLRWQFEERLRIAEAQSTWSSTAVVVRGVPTTGVTKGIRWVPGNLPLAIVTGPDGGLVAIPTKLFGKAPPEEKIEAYLADKGYGRGKFSALVQQLAKVKDPRTLLEVQLVQTIEGRR